MEKVKWNSVNKKQNGLEHLENKKSYDLAKSWGLRIHAYNPSTDPRVLIAMWIITNTTNKFSLVWIDFDRRSFGQSKDFRLAKKGTIQYGYSL